MQSLVTSCDVTIVYIKSWPYYGYMAMNFGFGLLIPSPASVFFYNVKVLIEVLPDLSYRIYLINNFEFFYAAQWMRLHASPVSSKGKRLFFLL